ncbi:restriction endonuclease subunit S [Nocardia terpenica]|uniref:restriction endonuclease subunit S n=1 Tax=Nocardia terpenica TaxID=455432 RepID=UPI0018955E5F|nr:restriction endonuclease subunit S [Nocardia terpenica]MBF6060454.1 restriction endonuclease subunit S [Nocardia terpenica]MBF6103714.1 restriction endonuclease subunit S [Nocardia terpenica]MBF6111912.1 restriction endonuclease subunit S [Nocardia terpenica]MBF6117935.1 restriction endonuclease subunit S [Nocardia terpenica]MBF6155339.1 restriction endonuclease subunit S [Nocardia terpenica]
MNWPEVAVRRVVECLDGRRVPLNREQRSLMPGEVPYWGAGGVIDYVNEAIFDEPLVLVGEDGAPFFETGKDVSHYIEGPAWINNHIHALSAVGCDPKFLSYALNSVDYGYYITGATRDKLTQDDLKRIYIPSPPLEEQRRIADFLDAETSRIDSLSAHRRAQIELLQERFSTEISELLTPGLADLSDRSERWPWLPSTLQTIRLGYLARVQTGVTVHNARESTEDSKEYPYLRVANVQGEHIDLSEIKTIRISPAMAQSTTLQPGDVVTTEANGNPDNLGRGAVWQGEIPGMVHQNHVFAIRVDRSKLMPEYVSALLASIHGRRYFRFTSTQVGIATTSSSKVLDFPIPIRSLRSQNYVVNACESARRYRDSLSGALTNQLSLLAERRQALITAAVTGQFDVTTASGRNITQGV